VTRKAELQMFDGDGMTEGAFVRVHSRELSTSANRAGDVGSVLARSETGLEPISCGVEGGGIGVGDDGISAACHFGDGSAITKVEDCESSCHREEGRASGGNRARSIVVRSGWLVGVGVKIPRVNGVEAGHMRLKLRG